MTPVNYKELAARGVRGNLSPSEQQLLRSPQALQHWYDALVLIKLGVVTQLSSRAAKVAQTRLDFVEQAARSGGTVVMHHEGCKVKDQNICTCQPFKGSLDDAWLRFKVEHLTWRTRALKFLSAIETHIQECKTLKRQQHHKTDALRDAIKRHKEQLGLEDASDVDVELWALLGDEDPEPDHYSAVS